MKSGGSVSGVAPRDLTPARPFTAYRFLCVARPPLGNIADGHNFLYAEMTLRKVASDPSL